MADNISVIAAMSDAYKSFFLPGLREQADYGASAFLAQLERNTESVVGKDIRITMEYGRSGGIGAISEAGSFPVANAHKFKQATWETRDLAAQTQISDKAIEASKSSVGAFANMMTKQVKDVERDVKIYVGRSVLGDGTGKLGVIHSVTWDSTAKTLTCVMTSAFPTVYLSEGMLVDIIDASATPDATLTGGTTLEVIAVDDDLLTVTLKGLLADLTDISATIQADNDYLVAQGSLGRELTGLSAVYDNAATLYGLSRTTYPWLKVPGNTSVGEINDMAIQALIDKAETRSGSTINYMQCAHDVKRAYINYKAALRQTVDSLEIKGGFTAMSYVNGGKKIPITPDKYLPNGYLDGMDTNDWALYAMNDWSWRDQGAGLFTKVAGVAAWEAQLIRFCDVGCQRPRGQFRASGISGA
ncbi:MAG: phage major capsid protein [Bacteroidales bacterium]|nr:phage major capsid protein [Bacteroidales bacterium]